MNRLLGTSLLIILCHGTTLTWMLYIGHPYGRSVDPGAIVFPSSLESPFDLPNRIQSSELQKEYLHAVEALFAVTTRLKTFLGKDVNKNVLVSPLSTATALGEILIGARGKSRQQLLSMLSTVNRTSGLADATAVEFHQQLGGLIKHLQTNSDYDKSYQLELASAMFLKPEIRVHREFITAITDFYGVDIEPMDFSENPVGSMNAINLWASRHTRGIIKKVLAEPLPTETGVVLTNAIYFKGDWETPFNPQYTIPGKFMASKMQEVSVEYMRGEFELRYVSSSRLKCRMIAIPYKHEKAAMYIILPDNDRMYNIQTYASELSIHDVRELITAMTPESVTLVMPKMTLTQSFSLREALTDFQKQTEGNSQRMDKKLVADIYSNDCEGSACPPPGHVHEMSCRSSAQLEIGPNRRTENKQAMQEDHKSFYFNLTGASPDKSFRIDDVIQQIFLEVNEVGTVAAAVSVSTVDKIGDIRNFKIDRPFIFFIRHEVTGTPLFWGTIVDPSSTGDEY